MVNLRSRVTALLVVTAAALTMMQPSPARAAEPIYTITDVTRAWFYTGPPDLTACPNRYASPLVLDMDATVQDPVAPLDHQVEVKGLGVEIYSGDVLLGTVQPQLAVILLGDSSGTFMHISCRAWGRLLAKGFGGPRPNYGIKIVGTGEAFDVNDGSAAGAVEAPDTVFPVTLGQFAKTTKLNGAKAGGDVVVSTSLRTWAKANGEYGWRYARNVRVVLFKLRNNRYRPIDSVRTARNGNFKFRFAAGNNNYIRFRVPGFTTGEATWWVKRNGDILPGGR